MTLYADMVSAWLTALCVRCMHPRSQHYIQMGPCSYATHDGGLVDSPPQPCTCTEYVGETP